MREQEADDAVTVDDVVGIFKAWLEDHWAAPGARFVLHTQAEGVAIEHHSERTFRRSAN